MYIQICNTDLCPVVTDDMIDLSWIIHSDIIVAPVAGIQYNDQNTVGTMEPSCSIYHIIPANESSFVVRCHNLSQGCICRYFSNDITGEMLVSQC